MKKLLLFGLAIVLSATVRPTDGQEAAALKGESKLRAARFAASLSYFKLAERKQR